MAEEPQPSSLRERFGARGEEALGRIAQDLLENPLVNSVLTAAFEARGRASAAQDVAMEFLNLPSAAHIERLTRRVRSISQRLESIEDACARLDEALRSVPAPLAARLDAIEQQLTDLGAALAELREREAGTVAVSRDQERLRVGDPSADEPPADLAAG